MRIDLVITELDLGGAERCCCDLAIYLSKKGHCVRVLALGHEPPPNKQELLNRLNAESITAHFLGARSWRNLPRARSQLRRLIKTDPPAIAQAFLWHANVLSASVYPQFGVPLVGGVRVADPRRSRFFLSRWASKRMSKVVCVSHSIEEWCREREGIEGDKLLVIPNGIDIERIRIASQRGLRSDEIRTESDWGLKKKLLFVGRLDHQKGVDILLQHATSILSRLPDFHLVLLGDGPMRDQVHQWALESNYPSRIHILGHRTDVPFWMKASDLLVFPTRYEGMPNVVLEAMAMGMPIVATRVEGISELLGELVLEQTAEKDDWADWESKVISLAQDTIKRNSLGEKNAERVKMFFKIEEQMAKYEKLYQLIANSPGVLL